MNEIHLAYTLSKKQYMGALSYHLKAHQITPRYQILESFGVITLGLVLYYVFWSHWIMLLPTVVGVLSLIMDFLIPLIHIIVFRFAKKYKIPINVTFSDKKIHAESGNGTYDFEWLRYKNYLETPEHLLLYQDKYVYSVIPKSAFSNEDQLRQLIQMIDGHIAKTEIFPPKTSSLINRIWKSPIATGAILILLLLLVFWPFSDDSPSMHSSSSIATPAFDGTYNLDVDASFVDLIHEISAGNPQEQESAKQLLEMIEDQYYDFQIDHGVIMSGNVLVQEFCLQSATIDNGRLEGEAIWHEDIYDPGDSCNINVILELEDDVLEFWYFYEGEDQGEPIVLIKESM